MTLPREQLLEGSPDPQGLAPLLDLAEEVLRTWQPRWSGFLSAPLQEDALERLGHLSELQWERQGGHAGAERCRLLCHRRDAGPEGPPPIEGLLIEGNFLFDPLSPADLRQALQTMGAPADGLGDLWVRGDRGGQGLCTPACADLLDGGQGQVRDVPIRCERRSLEQLQLLGHQSAPHPQQRGGLLSSRRHRLSRVRYLPLQGAQSDQGRPVATQLADHPTRQP